MLREANAENLYLITGYTDMRKSIDALAMIIQSNLSLNPFNKSLFLFCGKRCDRIKGLLWEGDGFLMLYKESKTQNFNGHEMKQKYCN